MNDLEEKLQEIYTEITKKGFFFAELYWSRAKEVCENAKKEEITDQAKEKMLKIFVAFVDSNKKHAKDIQKGEYTASNESLDAWEENFKEILKNIDKFSEEEIKTLDADFVSETKNSIKAIREELIPVLREFADVKSQLDALKKNEENFSWQRVRELYEKAKKRASATRSAEWLVEVAETSRLGIFVEIYAGISRLIEMIEKNEDVPPNAYPSTAEDLNFFQEMVNEFPQMLEQAKKKFPREAGNSEVEEAKEKHEQQIKDKLSQKRTQQKVLKNKVNSQQANSPQPEKGFNWLYVVIPGGILLVIMGIVIAYLIGKRK